MGGVRTALYNYLFARRHGGKMILRIEDTDSQRFVPGAEEYIIESLKWCGIEIDEGVGVGGPHAPYRQSERREIYLKYAKQLVEAGWAYYAFDTPEELDKFRGEAEAAGKTFAYNYEVREKLPTSLVLSKEEVEERIARGDQWVVRFKMPENEVVKMDDLIRGHVEVNTSTLDDKVLYKSADALPTYHLANIVDDHLMEVSHVIRGEEWLPSAPLHVLLYRAFGWEDTMPQFAHLSLLLKPEGNGKLSKRDGDRLGFPVFPLEWNDPKSGSISSGFRESDYLPEAVVNFLALLGWNPGDDVEMMSMEELVKKFDLSKCSKAGARFDYKKMVWFNHEYILRKSDREIAEIFMNVVKAHGVETTLEHLEMIVSLMKGRVNFVHELWDASSFYFEAPQAYDEKTAKKRWKEDSAQKMTELADLLESLDDFSIESQDAAVHEWIEAKGYGMGDIMNAFRLALVGEGKGPQMFHISGLIGKEETLSRLRRAITVLG